MNTLVQIINTIGFVQFAIVLSIPVGAILFVVLLIRNEKKLNRLNPEHHSLEYLRKHQDEYREYFDEFPGLR